MNPQVPTWAGVGASAALVALAIIVAWRGRLHLVHDIAIAAVRAGVQLAADVRVVTIYGSDNEIDSKVLDVLIRKHREIRKSTGISVPVPDEAASKVTDAVVQWLLGRDKTAGDQQALFELDEVTGQQALDLDAEWNSMAERERRSRSRYAQGSIHPDEVAQEVAATRAALGPDDEIRFFTRTALRALGADLTGPAGGDFTVTATSRYRSERDKPFMAERAIRDRAAW